jgi:hypothetical protein
MVVVVRVVYINSFIMDEGVIINKNKSNLKELAYSTI